MESSVEWNDDETTIQMGDFGMVALEVSDFGIHKRDWMVQALANGMAS